MTTVTTSLWTAAEVDPRLPAGLETPALVVDLDVVRRNVRTVADVLTARDVALRPHAKTHKSRQVARLLAECGARGATTATLGEAEVLADGGTDDLFVAYPVWAGTPSRSERLVRLADRARLAVGIDSVEGATALGRAATAAREPLRVLVELDSGEGRTGTTPDRVVVVADAARRAGLQVVGVFTHGGHSYAGPDAAAAAAADEVEVLATGAALLRADGHDVQVLSAGSTPTALASGRDGVNEVRPGTFVFGDRQQVMLGAVAPESIALAVLTTVVSTAVPGQFVLDAGAKTLGKDRHPLLEGHGHLPAFPDAVVTRLYDHHAVVEVAGQRPPVGEVLVLVPNHVCPVVNLSERLHVLDGDRVDVWPVDARGRNS